MQRILETREIFNIRRPEKTAEDQEPGQGWMGIINCEWKEISKLEEAFWHKKTRLIDNLSGVDGNYQLVSARNIRNKRKI